MASIIVGKKSAELDAVFFREMQTHILNMTRSYKEIFFLYYKGTFEFTIDDRNPGVTYIRKPGEVINYELLKTHLNIINSLLLSFATDTIKGTPEDMNSAGILH